MSPDAALLCRPAPRVVRAAVDIHGLPDDPRVIHAGELLHLAPPEFLSAQYLGPRGCNLSALRAAGMLYVGELVPVDDDEGGTQAGAEPDGGAES